MMQTLIDRTVSGTYKNQHLDRMVSELSRYMTDAEIDEAVALVNTLGQSEFDINLTVGDSAAQLQLLLGQERYEQVRALWSRDNQHLIPVGVKKFLRKSDNTLWDGLDAEDDASDYQEILI